MPDVGAVLYHIECKASTVSLDKSGVSRISVRGVLKVRPDTRRGGGGCCRFLARYEKRGGGMIAYRGARDIVQ